MHKPIMALIAALVIYGSNAALADENAAPMSKYAARFLAKYEISSEPVECIGDHSISPKPKVRRIVYLDRHRFVVEFRKRGTFLNLIESEKGCRGMKKNALVEFFDFKSRHRFTLCRGDSIRVHQKTTYGAIPIGRCDAGNFYEMKKLDKPRAD